MSIKAFKVSHLEEILAGIDHICIFGDGLDLYCNGWPDTKEEVPLSVQGYLHFRDELSVQDGLVLKGEGLVVPKSIREEIKQTLHQVILYPVLFEERKRSGLVAWNE